LLEIKKEHAEEVDEEINLCLAAFIAEDNWFLDFGVTSHVIGNKNLMSDLHSSSVPSNKLIGAQIMPIVANSTVKKSDVTNEIKSIYNVLYMPGVHTNLLSVERFTDQGYLVTFTSTQCYIHEKITMQKSIYKLLEIQGINITK
jgi:hypothetical protein